jgi:molybdopterin biosynthesis enzyme
MDADFTSPQRIARLTPLAGVLAAVEQIKPVAAREVALADALGRTLAADIAAPRALPASAVALRDGFAVQADTTADASAYAPIPLARMPQRIDAGETIPRGADAVAPLDTIAVSGKMAQAIASATIGDGILPAGADAGMDKPIAKAGQLLRASDIAALTACGVSSTTIREPNICVVRSGANDKANATVALIVKVLEKSGARVTQDDGLARALRRSDCDAIVAIGGTGSGRGDKAVETLSRSGKLIAHGIGVMPGDTSAFGFIEHRPLLLLPGRIDAALAVWLTIGQPLVSRLSGRKDEGMAASGVLSRKVVSTIGVVDVVPVRRNADRVEPLGSGYWPMQALAQADGYIVVPAQSEGYSEGATVTVRPLP